LGSSECPSPRSPEVSSPVGLGVLPAISPLASTPIDIPSFDIPEAQKPLPASPVEQSPVTVVVDLKPQSLPIPSTSPLSTSSSQSYITSPQELSEDPVFSTSIETAVTSPVTPVVAPAFESVKPNPLHCRVCLADSCDDITASMCGHIFCNRYILLLSTLSFDISSWMCLLPPDASLMQLSKLLDALCAVRPPCYIVFSG